MHAFNFLHVGHLHTRYLSRDQRVSVNVCIYGNRAGFVRCERFGTGSGRKREREREYQTRAKNTGMTWCSRINVPHMLSPVPSLTS